MLLHHANERGITRILTYASPRDPHWKRWAMRVIEDMSGRGRLLPLYHRWRTQVAGKSPKMMSDLLEMIGTKLDISVVDLIDGDQGSADTGKFGPRTDDAKRGSAAWPVAVPADMPLVIIANHPFGIGDGIAALALAEQLDRPYRILINSDFMKVPEDPRSRTADRFLRKPRRYQDQYRNSRSRAPAPEGRRYYSSVSGRRCRDRRTSGRQSRGAAMEGFHGASDPARRGGGPSGLFRGAEQRPFSPREPLQLDDLDGADGFRIPQLRGYHGQGARWNRRAVCRPRLQGHAWALTDEL